LRFGGGGGRGLGQVNGSWGIKSLKVLTVNLKVMLTLYNTNKAKNKMRAKRSKKRKLSD